VQRPSIFHAALVHVWTNYYIICPCKYYHAVMQRLPLVDGRASRRETGVGNSDAVSHMAVEIDRDRVAAADQDGDTFAGPRLVAA
jgi:hypothetical protein